MTCHDPGSPHDAGRLQAWRELPRLPMRYRCRHIHAEAEPHPALGSA